ncbi:hypothetical protein [Shinella oryzae]|uniref:hypothetical protein n=1 Tax=Shinella oryzae TaxID=2871820 RepID=UPI001FF4174F|nr:hypothetical protein [Shinella oryzae]UPA24338.1 hypothetical protein K6301_14495 [Shinella oryzae]
MLKARGVAANVRYCTAKYDFSAKINALPARRIFSRRDALTYQKFFCYSNDQKMTERALDGDG